MKWTIAILIFVTLAVVAAQTSRAAGVEETIWKTESLMDKYKPNGEALKNDSGAIFYRYTGLRTKPMGLDAGSGNMITKIEVKRDGNVVQTIQVNSRTYNGELEFSGQPILFKSTENEGNGSWFAWQMGSGDTRWTAGHSSNGYDETSLGTPPKKSGTSPPADQYPNKLIQQTVDQFVRTEAFKNDSYPQITSTAYLDNRIATLQQLSPPHDFSNVRVWSIMVETPSVDRGFTDDSTELSSYKPYAEINGEISLDRATITFTQRHDNDKYYRKLPAG